VSFPAFHSVSNLHFTTGNRTAVQNCHATRGQLKSTICTSIVYVGHVRAATPTIMSTSLDVRIQSFLEGALMEVILWNLYADFHAFKVLKKTYVLWWQKYFRRKVQESNQVYFWDGYLNQDSHQKFNELLATDSWNKDHRCHRESASCLDKWQKLSVWKVHV
jgi:hypothetical protein